jgi:lysophospholipase L1-like esterase
VVIGSRALLKLVAGAALGFCMPPSASAAQLHEIAAGDAHVAAMGRTQRLADGSLRFSYPGVSLFVEVEGSKLVLGANSTGEQSYLDVIVDEGASTTYRLSTAAQQIVLFDFAKPGHHRVEIVHRSETWHGTVTIASLATDGRFLDAPRLPQRRMLVLGDSVTCGEAIDRIKGAKKEPAWWNPRQSYGMMAAKELGAQVQLVCMGGHGLVRSWNGKTDEFNLSDYYRLAIPDLAHPIAWDQSLYAPDLIVSAIGTNDFNLGIPDHDAYLSAYLRLVAALRADHPQALILLTEGAILNGERKAALTGWLQEVVGRSGDARVRYVPSNHYPGDETDAHPTREQHAAMAHDLVREIRRELGAGWPAP